MDGYALPGPQPVGPASWRSQLAPDSSDDRGGIAPWLAKVPNSPRLLPCTTTAKAVRIMADNRMVAKTRTNASSAVLFA